MMGKSETLQDKLHQFHKAFGHPVDAPYPKPWPRVDSVTEGGVIIDPLQLLRKKLIEEEFSELIAAIDRQEDEDVLKELCDLVYVCVGFAVTYGWNFDTAFNRVHHSNMSKLDEDGNPIYREDGKVVKSDRYEPPSMKGMVPQFPEREYQYTTCQPDYYEEVLMLRQKVRRLETET
jgi:predicted HAD superfamily Cof-like phosphohydrolase